MAPPAVRTAILVPRRAGDRDRDRIWRFTRRRWADLGWPITEGHHDTGPFNRAAAVNRAAAQAGEWDVACIVDADVLCDWDAVRTAAREAPTQGRMVVAGDRIHHLTRAGTRRVLAGYRGSWDPLVEITYARHWSSCVAISRDLWERVGGFDEGFEGWGYEDDAFKLACETISGRPMLRLPAPIWHLWHPRSPDPVSRKANKARADQYRRAAGRPARMRALIDR